jgi:hypothetical protein
MAGRFGIGTLKSSAARTPIEKDLNCRACWLRTITAQKSAARRPSMIRDAH